MRACGIRTRYVRTSPPCGKRIDLRTESICVRAPVSADYWYGSALPYLTLVWQQPRQPPRFRRPCILKKNSTGLGTEIKLDTGMQNRAFTVLHEQWRCLGMQRHAHITLYPGNTLIPLTVPMDSLSTTAKLRLPKSERKH